MATAPMSRSLQALVNSQVSRLLGEAAAEFSRSLLKRPVQPMTTYTNSWDVEIVTPQDGTREFVITVTVSEDSSPAGTPTTGHSISSK